MPTKLNFLPGGVTAPQGFLAGGVTAGIKASQTPDLAILLSTTPCAAAGTFTRNAIRASSVDWCSDLLPSDKIRGIIVNSGCANACTGKRGEKDTDRMAALAAEALGVPARSVLVASTGVIGQFLPMAKIAQASRRLSKQLSTSGGGAFARAIMTTDTIEKESGVKVSFRRGAFAIGGCCKGSGMIHPDMATMLAFITTDARISARALSPIVKRVVGRTFNNLTVDGDTSTNDMVLVLSSGASGIGIVSSEDRAAFEEGLEEVCGSLCRKIAADGEGATKRVEVRVRGGRTASEAKLAAKAVAASNLTKCALFGNDPNWGRIACAVGYSGATFSHSRMTIRLCGIPVFRNLQPIAFDEKEAHRRLAEKVVVIEVDLGAGTAKAVAHTCDLSYDYVKINAEYHT